MDKNKEKTTWKSYPLSIENRTLKRPSLLNKVLWMKVSTPFVAATRARQMQLIKKLIDFIIIIQQNVVNWWSKDKVYLLRLSIRNRRWLQHF